MKIPARPRGLRGRLRRRDGGRAGPANNLRRREAPQNNNLAGQRPASQRVPNIDATPTEKKIIVDGFGICESL
jgi:hypothetical protein